MHLVFELMQHAAAHVLGLGILTSAHSPEHAMVVVVDVVVEEEVVDVVTVIVGQGRL